MKILILGDVESPYLWEHYGYEKYKDVELIISCGDLKAEYLSYIVSVLKAPLFYVPGNHDKKYAISPPEGCDNIDGKFVIYKNLRIIGLGGSYRYNCGIYQYTEREMKKRILKLFPKLLWHRGFDILVTHAPASGLNEGMDLCHKGFKAFIKLMDLFKPKFLFHGHQHLNYGKIKRITEYGPTTVINSYEFYVVEV